MNENKQFDPDIVINNAKDWISNNIYYIFTLATSIVYIALGLVEVIKTNKSVIEIIATGILGSIVGYLIGALLSKQGLKVGGNSKAFLEARSKLYEAVGKSYEYADMMDEFCEIKTQEKLRELRMRILGEAGLKIVAFENGEYDEYLAMSEKKLKKGEQYTDSKGNIVSKVKIKAVKKAYKLKIQPLTMSAITTDGASKKSRKIEPFYLGQTKDEYMVKDEMSTIASKVLWIFVLGYFTMTLLQEIDIGKIIWSAMQVVLFVGFGMMRWFDSYIFMSERMVARYNKQRMYNEMFLKWIEKKGVKTHENNN